MEDILQIVDKQKENFKKLEDKLEVIVGKCNKKTLVKSYKPLTSITNAKRVEQHTLDDGLQVCFMFNYDDKCINMLVSATPIFEEYEFTDRQGGKHTNYKYTGAPGIEYCWGGDGNSLFFPSGSFLHEQIGIFENCNDRMTKTASTIPTMAGGYDLQFLIYGSINEYDISNLDVFYENRQNCDIEGCILNYETSDEEKRETIDGLKLCIEKINKIVNKKNDKKGFLKELLSKFKKNKDKINDVGGKTL